MYNFVNDYSKSCHENILKAMNKINDTVYTGYGNDTISINTRNLINNIIKKDAVIQFLIGGTLTNKVGISHSLKPYEAIIAPTTAHIAVHETGAIEDTGHRIIEIPSYNGKIISEDIIKAFNLHTDEHLVKPKLVYISNTTECGTIYSKEELEQIYNTCKKLDLYLYIDGARLACCLSSSLTLEDIANNCDIFTIGAAKNGALFGEALVIVNENLKENIRYTIKQKGAMISKGWLVSLQFNTLFEDNLFFTLGEHSNSMAKKLANSFESVGIKFRYPVQSNQIFPIIQDKHIDKLKEKANFEIWEKLENETVVRFVCSFSTLENEVNDFCDFIKNNF